MFHRVIVSAITVNKIKLNKRSSLTIVFKVNHFSQTTRTTHNHNNGMYTVIPPAYLNQGGPPGLTLD